MSQMQQKQPDNENGQHPVQQQQQVQPQIIIHQVKEVEDQNQNKENQVQNEPEQKNIQQKKKDEVKLDNEQMDPEEEQDVEGEGQEGGEDGPKQAQKQSSDSNRQDNDTSQLQTGGGKRCFNRLCNSKKIYKKIRSRVQIQRYRFLCKNCYDNYVNNSFCQFCQQIYSNYENEEDDTKWVGCDKCQRWNHIECQRKYRHKNFQINKDKDTQYECLACSKKNKNGQVQAEIPIDNNKRKPIQRGDYEGTRNYRTKIQINKDERIPIFHKKPETFPCLESFLQTYNFRLWLNDANIRQDIQSLRSTSRRQPTDQQPKKTKKVKTDY